MQVNNKSFFDFFTKKIGNAFFLFTIMRIVDYFYQYYQTFRFDVLQHIFIMLQNAEIITTEFICSFYEIF